MTENDLQMKSRMNDALNIDEAENKGITMLYSEIVVA